MQLWTSRHLHTQLVALNIIDMVPGGAARPAVPPRRVRIVDQRVAEVAEAIAHDGAPTAAAAGKVSHIDLDDLVRQAEATVAAAGSPD